MGQDWSLKVQLGGKIPEHAPGLLVPHVGDGPSRRQATVVLVLLTRLHTITIGHPIATVAAPVDKSWFSCLWLLVHQAVRLRRAIDRQRGNRTCMMRSPRGNRCWKLK